VSLAATAVGASGTATCNPAPAWAFADDRNVLLVFIPIGERRRLHHDGNTMLIAGWALYLAKHNGGKDSISDTACFITNFIAIIPLGGRFKFSYGQS
jgi:hypothetical protein